MDFESPTFIKYQDAYERNRHSRVFAPLADMYRKMGMIDKSLKVLRDGLSFHPDYLLAHMTYAHCCLDLQKFDQAFEALKPFNSQAKENLQFQRLYAIASFEVGNFDESLLAYQYILFVSPKDTEAPRKIASLLLMKKKEFSRHDVPDLAEIESLSFDEKNLNISAFDANEENFHDWVELDVASQNSWGSDAADVLANDAGDHWEVHLDGQFSETKMPIELSSSKSLKGETQTEVEDERHYFIDTDNVGPETKESEEEKETPFITHTLVELYLSQGLYQKAKEILEKMLLLNPRDALGQEKFKEIEKLFLQKKREQFCEKRKASSVFYKFKVKEKLYLFHNLLKQKAQNYSI